MPPPRSPGCPAFPFRSLEHFFKTHGQVDGFGSKSIKKLVTAGIDTLEKIYSSTEEDFQQAGFGPGQSKNLRSELNRSLEVEIEDWRFLSAFGIPQLGQGDSRRLLQNIQFDELSEVTKEEIIAIEGFAEITSADIVAGLKMKWPTIEHMLDLGFKLSKTPLLLESALINSPISGMKVVFTGKMLQSSRGQMKKNALELGAKIHSSVSGKTDILICGENAGLAKIDKAEELGVQVMSEQDYVIFLNNQ